MRTVRFGLIGCGLMGREFASAAARWAHLLDLDVRPELVAICDRNAALFPWYQTNFPAIRQVTDDYRAVLANPEAAWTLRTEEGRRMEELRPRETAWASLLAVLGVAARYGR